MGTFNIFILLFLGKENIFLENVKKNILAGLEPGTSKPYKHIPATYKPH